MTSRQRRFLASLPVVVLAPLLAAPRGCHFGDGDVPLGHDATGGDAGATGDGGVSGSAGNGGMPNVGGASGVGGNAGTGGSATGGGAGDTFAEPCLETLSPFDDTNTHGVDVTADEVDHVLGPFRVGWFTWPGGQRSYVESALAGVKTYYVESVPNPEFTEYPPNCANHLRAIATGRFWASDGTVDETIPGLEVDIDIPSPGMRISSAYAFSTLEGARFRGSYTAGVTADQCLLSLSFLMNLEPRFDGSIYEVIDSNPCGMAEAGSPVTFRGTGVFHCEEGLCTATASPALLVEAESCDGIGAQITHSGDETTFLRAGNTLSRTETYGCGCELYPSYVMTWAPSSPLELRLCTHDSKNACPGICEQELSYDLSTAFRVSGSTEFRFVD